MLLPHRLLVRAMLVLVCTVGLVGMHQFAAAAHGAGHDAMSASSHAHHVGMPGIAHDCSQDACGSDAGTSCAGIGHACAAVQSASWELPPATAVPIVIRPVSGVEVPTASIRSGADPPDLNVLSVSRT